MKLKKIISGGQTGVDRTALECARNMGLETGGTAPKGYRTESGPDPSLKEFGLVEHKLSSYPPRTVENVLNADATVWFGKYSTGRSCTEGAADKNDKPFYGNPTPEDFVKLAQKYETINVAGNRMSTHPESSEKVIAAFTKLAEAKDV